MKNFNCNIFCERTISLFGDVGQVELSEKIGISQGVISAIKNKKAKFPASDTVFKIARYFNVSSDWLLGLSECRTTDKATKDLCATLGLSDTTITFLSDDETKKACAIVDIFVKELCSEKPDLIDPLYNFFQSIGLHERN